MTTEEYTCAFCVEIFHLLAGSTATEIECRSVWEHLGEAHKIKYRTITR